MRKTAGLLLVGSLFATACALRPPRVSLEPLGTVGLVEFRTTAKGTIGVFAAQVFLEVVIKSQPGVRIKELGPEEALLAEVGADRPTSEAAAALGRKFGLDAVFFGTLEMSDIRPRIDIASIITSATASADVEAVLSIKLIDAREGTTLWAGSARDRRSVGQVSIFKGGGVFFDARDPKEAYGDLVYALAHRVTRDFQWRRGLW
ncbi:MAG: hypothetical protein FJY82_06410 [Candidatus Aminicenantes bacterium]|nr:hypothetical protein [Candidatus Aminicenantes bacterium]